MNPLGAVRNEQRDTSWITFGVGPKLDLVTGEYLVRLGIAMPRLVSGDAVGAAVVLLQSVRSKRLIFIAETRWRSMQTVFDSNGRPVEIGLGGAINRFWSQFGLRSAYLCAGADDVERLKRQILRDDSLQPKPMIFQVQAQRSDILVSLAIARELPTTVLDPLSKLYNELTRMQAMPGFALEDFPFTEAAGAALRSIRDFPWSGAQEPFASDVFAGLDEMP